jgi:hypothetical protein
MSSRGTTTNSSGYHSRPTTKSSTSSNYSKATTSRSCSINSVLASVQQRCLWAHWQRASKRRNFSFYIMNPR